MKLTLSIRAAAVQNKYSFLGNEIEIIHLACAFLNQINCISMKHQLALGDEKDPKIFHAIIS